MNILLDFITVRWRTGAGEYHRCVVLKLIERLLVTQNDVKLYAVYDSTYGIAYDELKIEVLNKSFLITFIDIQQLDISSIVQNYKIDRFFIACGQYIGQYKEIERLTCEVICVIHDLSHEELSCNRVGSYLKILEPKYQKGIKAGIKLAKYFFTLCTRNINENKLDGMYDLKFLIQMLERNPKSRCIVVSEYTKTSLIYNYKIDEQKIEVLYTPLRYEPIVQPLENTILKSLIESNKKYFLAVSCNRRSKNPEKLIRAFTKYSEYDNNAHLVLISYTRKITHPRIISLDFLSDSDLAHALKNCYALVYPSFFEGFGLPPVEAMRYGKPILASNTTSIPEILRDAPIYFSPLYESDIFRALLLLNNTNYSEYIQRSKKRFIEIVHKQENDINKLINIILQ